MCTTKKDLFKPKKAIYLLAIFQKVYVLQLINQVQAFSGLFSEKDPDQIWKNCAIKSPKWRNNLLVKQSF